MQYAAHQHGTEYPAGQVSDRKEAINNKLNNKNNENKKNNGKLLAQMAQKLLKDFNI